MQMALFYNALTFVSSSALSLCCPDMLVCVAALTSTMCFFITRLYGLQTNKDYTEVSKSLIPGVISKNKAYTASCHAAHRIGVPVHVHEV